MSQDSRETLWLVVRFVAGLGVFLGIVALVSALFREGLEALGNGFVARFGLAGMAFGTFLADAFTFPIPPQFYMLLSVAGSRPVVPTMTAICAGSLVGGVTGYAMCRRLSSVPRVARFLERRMLDAIRFFDRYGYRIVIIASLTPVAYSVTCWLVGINRMSWRAILLLSVLRVPRLILYYYVIQLGWAL